MKHPLEYYPKRLNKFGRFLWRAYIIEIIPSADTTEFVFNKWNPLSYPVWLLLAILMFIFGGVTEVAEEWHRNKIYFDVGQYWKNNPNKLEFIPRSVKRRCM